MAGEGPTPNALFSAYFNTIIAIVSLIVTFLAIVAYFRSLTIRKAHQNLLLLNLLMNAMIFTILSVIFSGYGAIMRNLNILSIDWVCFWNGFLNVFCSSMEIYTLMCIALERYFVIVKQTPMTQNQIFAMLAFGLLWIGSVASLPLLSSSFYYSISDSRYYCNYSYKVQIIPAFCGALHITTCIVIIGFCYIQIYRVYRNLKKNVQENAKSTIVEGQAHQKKNDEELRILQTSVLLVGWTFIGWTPMLLMMTYQMITGNTANVFWAIVSSTMILISVCGDSIILLVYDNRWKASLQEMKLSIKKIFS